MGWATRRLRLVIATVGVSLSTFTNAAPTSIAEIGRQLFFDPQFSIDHRTSCSTCHAPEHAFSSSEPVAVGHDRLHGTRNAPSLLNATHYSMFFWDGRAPTIEDQVLRPFINEREFGLTSHDELLKKLRASSKYVSEFKRAFQIERSAIQSNHVATALAAYVRSLGGRPTRADCYLDGGNSEALSSIERQGLEVFRGQGGCNSCHTLDGRPAPLTDNKFHISGIGIEQIGPALSYISRKLAGLDSVSRENLIFRDPVVAAAGRFVVTTDPKDIGAFRTPSLRNVALTAPYMHDGSINTLEEAVDYELYYTGSERGTPIIITPAQKASLIAFLNSLNDSSMNESTCESASRVAANPGSAW